MRFQLCIIVALLAFSAVSRRNFLGSEVQAEPSVGTTYLPQNTWASQTAFQSGASAQAKEEVGQLIDQWMASHEQSNWSLGTIISGNQQVQGSEVEVTVHVNMEDTAGHTLEVTLKGN